MCLLSSFHNSEYRELLQIPNIYLTILKNDKRILFLVNYAIYFLLSWNTKIHRNSDIGTQQKYMKRASQVFSFDITKTPSHGIDDEDVRGFELHCFYK